MKDVAREAGVSTSTVSRVLAGREKVGADKQAAVEEACLKLGYQLDGVAAALRSGSSNSIGIVVPDITNPVFPAIIRAAEHELSSAALDLVLCDADNNTTIEAQRLQTLLRRRVDAVVVCPVHADRSATALRQVARHTRLIQLFRHALDDVDFVGVDQADGLRQVVEHLHAQGAASAVFVGRYQGMSSLTERAAAFETACQRVGLKSWPTIDVPFPDAPHGRSFVRQQLIRGDGLPDAIVCASDDLALGVLDQLRTAGISCPRDVLVTGFDDIPAAEYVGLTTVRQPLQDLGRQAARLLQHESNLASDVRLLPTLVARSTTTRSDP